MLIIALLSLYIAVSSNEAKAYECLGTGSYHIEYDCAKIYNGEYGYPMTYWDTDDGVLTVTDYFIHHGYTADSVNPFRRTDLNAGAVAERAAQEQAAQDRLNNDPILTVNPIRDITPPHNTSMLEVIICLGQIDSSYIQHPLTESVITQCVKNMTLAEQKVLRKYAILKLMEKMANNNGDLLTNLIQAYTWSGGFNQ